MLNFTIAKGFKSRKMTCSTSAPVRFYISPCKVPLTNFKGEPYTYNNIIDDFKLIRSLGEGGFGKVMLGRHKEKGFDVAIKYMDISENCKLPLTLKSLWLPQWMKFTKKLIH